MTFKLNHLIKLPRLDFITLVSVAIILPSCALGDSGHTIQRHIIHEGWPRTFELHVPSSYDPKRPTSLILGFHGGTQTGTGLEGNTGFSDYSDRTGDIVVYLNGLWTTWNNGLDRDNPTYVFGVPDVDFASTVIDLLGSEYNIDPNRVYAFGLSDGAVMTYRIGAELSDKIAAIAPVIGHIAEPVYESFAPTSKVSFLAFFGDSDRWMPVGGGWLPLGGGVVMPALHGPERWILHNQHDISSFSAQAIPDYDPTDGCFASLFRWDSAGQNPVEVILVNGGGHQWTGMPWHFLLGASCRDFDLTEEIGSFFTKNPKRRIIKPKRHGLDPVPSN